MDTILILLQLIINLLFIIWVTILERKINEHTRDLNILSYFIVQKDKKLKSKFEKMMNKYETENK